MKRGDRERHLMNEVRLILLNDWNPIGFPVPHDEYDSYITGVLRLLLAGADQHKLTEHLSTLEMTSMGLTGLRARCSVAAEKLRQIPLHG
jgi:hypothetical protein